MSSTTWFVRLGDQVLGPISDGELRDRAMKGTVTAQTQVSSDGTNWTEAATVVGIVFGPGLQEPVPPPPSTEPIGSEPAIPQVDGENEPKWYVWLGNDSEATGPISMTQLREMAIRGEIGPESSLSENRQATCPTPLKVGRVPGIRFPPGTFIQVARKRLASSQESQSQHEPCSSVATQMPAPEAHLAAIQGGASASQASRSTSATDSPAVVGYLYVLGVPVLLICVLFGMALIPNVLLWIIVAVAAVIAVGCGAAALFSETGGGCAFVGFVLCTIIATVAWYVIPSPPPPLPAPPPPAKPAIVKDEDDFHVFDNNRKLVWVRNDGDEGKVQVTVNWSENTYHLERGESGLEKKVREVLTRGNEPPPRVVNEEHYLGSWSDTRRLKQGETYQFTIELPGHSSLTGSLSVTARGLPDDTNDTAKK